MKTKTEMLCRHRGSRCRQAPKELEDGAFLAGQDRFLVLTNEEANTIQALEADSLGPIGGSEDSFPDEPYQVPQFEGVEMEAGEGSRVFYIIRLA